MHDDTDTPTTLWGDLRRRWFSPAGLPADDRMRCDIGLAPRPVEHRIPILVLAWLH